MSTDVQTSGLGFTGQSVRRVEDERLLAGDGLEVTARTGVKVNPLTRHFSLTRVTAVNYMLVARRPST